jgi:hypothetical protein
MRNHDGRNNGRYCEVAQWRKLARGSQKVTCFFTAPEAHGRYGSFVSVWHNSEGRGGIVISSEWLPCIALFQQVCTPTARGSLRGSPCSVRGVWVTTTLQPLGLFFTRKCKFSVIRTFINILLPVRPAAVLDTKLLQLADCISR